MPVAKRLYTSMPARRRRRHVLRLLLVLVVVVVLVQLWTAYLVPRFSTAAIPTPDFLPDPPLL